MDVLLPAKPESYHQIIKRSFLLYRNNFFKTIVLSLALSIIVFIPRIVSDLMQRDFFYNLGLLNPNRLWLVIIDLSALILFIGLLWRIHCEMVAVHEKLRDDFVVGIRKFIAVIAATLIQSAIIFLVAITITGIQVLLHRHHLLFVHSLLGNLFTVFIFAGQLAIIVYVSTLFIFFVALIAIENAGVLTSLEKSTWLVWNHWWRTFSVQVTPWMYYILLLFLVKYGLGIDIHIYFMDNRIHPLWTTGLHIILFALFIPWVAAILLTQLRDLELRKKLLPENDG